MWQIVTNQLPVIPTRNEEESANLKRFLTRNTGFEMTIQNWRCQVNKRWQAESRTNAQGDNILNRYQQVSGSYEEKNQNRPTLRLKRQTPQNNENAFFIKWFNYLIIKFLKQIFIY